MSFNYKEYQKEYRKKNIKLKQVGFNLQDEKDIKRYEFSKKINFSKEVKGFLDKRMDDWIWKNMKK